MSYFRRIIDRTLGPPLPHVRPALTPDSILENPAIEAKSTPTSRERKITRPGKEANPSLAAVDAKDDEARKVPGAPERLPQYPKETLLSAAADETMPKPESHLDIAPVIPSASVKESTPPRSYEQKVPAPHASKDAPAAEAGPETEIRIDKVLEPARRQPPSSEGAVRMQEPDMSAKPTRATAGEPPGRTFSELARSIVGKEKIHDTLPEPELEPLRASALSEKYTPDAGAKTSSDGQQERTVLAPAGSKGTKYSVHAQQPEETVVTINIGRIEVRAESPAEPAPVPRRRFSPSLSLADYLKQRSEVKAG
jgi:hypothetical protein